MMSFLLASEPSLGLFVSGRVSQFLILLVVTGLIYVMIRRAKAGLPIPDIRKMAGLEAMDEAIGRATEMGRPVLYSPGIGDYENAQTIASYAVLSYVAKRCAQYDTRLIHTNRNVFVHAITEEVVRQAYLEAGRPESYNEDDVRYISGFQFAYAAGVLGIIQREQVAACVYFGAFWAESMLFIEGAALGGAVQIGATANTHQLPFFLAASDYCLIGEEMYAASAYLSREPVLTGTVVGQDIMRIIFVVLMLLGTLLAYVTEVNPLVRFLREF